MYGVLFCSLQTACIGCTGWTELIGLGQIVLYLLLTFALISISYAAAHDGRKKQVPIKQEDEEIVLVQLGEDVGSEEEVDEEEESSEERGEGEGEGDGKIIPEPQPASWEAQSTTIEVPGKKEGGKVDPSQSSCVGWMKKY